MSTPELLLTAGEVFAAVLCALTLRRALGQAARLAVRTAIGGGILSLLAPLGNVIGVHLGVNLYTALTLGVLGAPGLGLLLMLSWMVRG